MAQTKETLNKYTTIRILSATRDKLRQSVLKEIDISDDKRIQILLGNKQ